MVRTTFDGFYFANCVLCPVFSLRSFRLEKKVIKKLHNQNKALHLWSNNAIQIIKNNKNGKTRNIKSYDF